MQFHVYDHTKAARTVPPQPFSGEHPMSSLLIVNHASTGKLRRWSGQLARQSATRLLVASLADLTVGLPKQCDREIHRLFGAPAHRGAVILILGAAALLQSPEAPRYAYLLARIADHHGTVVLDAGPAPAPDSVALRLDAEWVTLS